MSDNNKTTLNIADDGPYIVEGLKSLSGKSGALSPKAMMALCRCGGSSNKPYCDGTHAKNGFSGDNTADASLDKLIDYEGAGITIHDNRSICAHAGICTDRLSSVFMPKTEPWIHPNAATPDEIMAIVKSCPSGALSVSSRQEDESQPSVDSHIAVAPGGPYVVSGDVELLGVPRAVGASASKYTLCRCGASKNKPFCDGTHWTVTFDDQLNSKEEK